MVLSPLRKMAAASLMIISTTLHATTLLATPDENQTSPPDSILLPPTGLDIYSGAGSPSDTWSMRLHGIRNGALHPGVWGARKDQRTESHNIVPIKRYYLRSSEAPGYRINHIHLEFSFWRANEKQMLNFPEKKDPVLEIEFANDLVPGPPGELPDIDRAYSLRLSAFPPIPSGVFFRSHLRSSKITGLNGPPIETSKNYILDAHFSDTRAQFILNGEQIAEVSANGINRGLLSIVSSWSPVTVLKLEVEGHTKTGRDSTSLHESGLIVIPKATKKQSDSPVPKDNKELDKALMRPAEEGE